MPGRAARGRTSPCTSSSGSRARGPAARGLAARGPAAQGPAARGLAARGLAARGLAARCGRGPGRYPPGSGRLPARCSPVTCACRLPRHSDVAEPPAGRTLRLGTQSFGPRQRVIMAIVNRTPDSFYDRGATWQEAAAMDRVHAVVAEGADIVDIGGGGARPGAMGGLTEGIRRTAPFIAAVRDAYPDLVISADTWRHEVVREACAAGADLLNDTWAGWDPRAAEVAAEHGAGPCVVRSEEHTSELQSPMYL